MTDAVLRRAMLVLAGIGLGVASYLVYVHYSGVKPVCALGGGCERVQTSQWSKLAGIPVADIGLAGYFGIIAALLVLRGELQRLMLVALTIVGLAFSAYLTYREVFTINAICQWCVSSAVIMTLLAGLAVARFLRGDATAPRSELPIPETAYGKPGEPVGTSAGRLIAE
jgi:uncharacterized membrane protein